MATMGAPTRTARVRLSVSPFAAAVGGVVLVAAVLRFATLGDQSLWYDEAQTLGWVHDSFGGMLDGVHSPGEAEPPLYFVVAWAWTRVFGYDEVGLRSLSAVLGILTVPVAYLAAKTLFDRWAGLLAAALVAFSPVLVWYSQEGRAYALLVFLSATAFLFFVRSLDSGRGRDYAAWSIASGLALATHYFAIFLIAVEAIWLLVRAHEHRRAVLAVGGVALFGAALAPLALYQRSHGGVEWISASPLRGRLRDALTVLATGAAEPGHQAVLAVVAFAVVVAVVVWRGDGRTRAAVAVALAIGVAAVGGPVIAALVGSDYVLDRNFLAAWVPLAVVVAGGAAIRSLRPAAFVVAAGICAVFLSYDVKLATNEDLARDDWRGVARMLGPTTEDRVVIVAPQWQVKPLAVYMPALRGMPTTERVREVDLIVFSRPGWGRDAPPQPPPGGPFRVVERRKLQWMTLVRFRAPRPSEITPAALTTRGENRSGVFLERSG